jgi:muramoyltetrapeptide carboxypeptidase
VFALSGPPDTERLQAGIERLEAEGFRVLLAPNVNAVDGYLAGSDTDRLDGLHFLLDSDVDLLWAARGGYGLMRVLPELPLERLAAWGGWVVGFSDVTALHAAMNRHCGVASLHGPMVASLTRHRGSALRVFELLARPEATKIFDLDAAQVIRPGRVRGRAVGGNLSLLAALVGTSCEPDYDGAVVFLEDVGEPLYRLDRLLTQLRLSSRLRRAKAILAGRLVQCGGGESGWRARWRDLLAEVAPKKAVVVDGLPFGHGAVNMAFPLGVEVVVDTGRGEVTWGGE